MANLIDFISVVIPLYNKENHIQRAIRSVLAQSYPYFEIVVVDDGSTDNSFESANRIEDERLRILRQSNGGVSLARNRGVSESQYDLVAFLDADDEWLPEFLESIFELKTQFPDADVFGSSFYTLNEDGSIRLPRSSPLFKKDWKGIIPNYIDTLQAESPFNSSSFAVRKQIFESIGGFPIGVKYGEDSDTWIRLSFISKIAYINTPLSIYHRETENRACVISREPLEVDYPVKELKRHLQLGELPEQQRQSAIEFIAKFHLSLAKTHLYLGNTDKAKELILSCEGTKKYFLKKNWLLFCAFFPPVILNSLIKIKHNAINPLFHVNDK